MRILAKDTLTLALNGEILLSDFSDAVTNLLKLVNALTKEVGSQHMDWQIEALEASSAIATVRGLYGSPQEQVVVEGVVRAYEEVGRTLERRESLSRSKNANNSARSIVKLVADRVTSVRFETDEFDYEIFQDAAKSLESSQVIEEAAGFGAVEGRIQSLTSRKGLRFTLYDAINDRAVSCYLATGSENVMREAWGKRSIVEGFVRRDPKTGRPTTIRRVSAVHIVEEGRPGGYLDAFGAAPIQSDEIMPEEAIRRLRDES